MFLIATDKRDILEWSPEQLRFIPKVVLLRDFGNYVEQLWDKLPDHLKIDPEVRSYRACMEHYNRPDQRTHIDGPPPLIRNCAVCRSIRRDE